MSEIKTLSGVEIKSEAEGKVLAHFATYDEIDHHGDITEKGAFRDGQEVVVSAYNHQSWGGSLPVGKGVIRDAGNGAVAELQFFMDTEPGRDTFRTVKNLGKLQQWSYGFDVIEKDYDEVEEKSVRILKKVNVHEVSPVLMGAGKSTRTLSIKSIESALDEFGVDLDELLAVLEEKAASKKPNNGKKPKPGQDDDDDSNSSKKPSRSRNDDDDEDEEDDDSQQRGNGKRPNRKPSRGRGGKKPSGSGKMRMFDQTDAVITAISDLADRAEEIVTLRKSQGKSDISDALYEQFTELLKQADRIFDILPQDDDGHLIEPDEAKAAAEQAELQKYAFSLSEEL